MDIQTIDHDATASGALALIGLAAPEPRALVAYHRVSTVKQGMTGLGMEAQRTATQAYAARIGATIIAEFTEVESGKVRDRPQLNMAMEMARKQRATLVVAKLDRLGRDAAFLMGLKRTGVEFVAVDFPEANRMIIGILAVLAEYEAERVSTRTKEALRAAKARGVKLGGFAGSAHETAAEVAARGRMASAALFAERRASTRNIVQAALEFSDNRPEGAAQQLNQSRVPTPSGRGQWHAKMVRRMIERGELRAPKRGNGK